MQPPYFYRAAKLLYFFIDNAIPIVIMVFEALGFLGELHVLPWTRFLIGQQNCSIFFYKLLLFLKLKVSIQLTNNYINV